MSINTQKERLQHEQEITTYWIETICNQHDAYENMALNQ
jgi:hypothetical protein